MKGLNTYKGRDMLDNKQIDVYFARSEQAVRETEQKYGSFCHRIAMNILGIHEDAEVDFCFAKRIFMQKSILTGNEVNSKKGVAI